MSGARWASETNRRRWRWFVPAALVFNTVAWIGHLAGWWR